MDDIEGIRCIWKRSNYLNDEGKPYSSYWSLSQVFLSQGIAFFFLYSVMFDNSILMAKSPKSNAVNNSARMASSRVESVTYSLCYANVDP